MESLGVGSGSIRAHPASAGRHAGITASGGANEGEGGDDGTHQLAVKTVQRIAVERGLCSPEEFHQKLKAIDLEDGQADSRAPIR